MAVPKAWQVIALTLLSLPAPLAQPADPCAVAVETTEPPSHAGLIGGVVAGVAAAGLGVGLAVGLHNHTVSSPKVTLPPPPKIVARVAEEPLPSAAPEHKDHCSSSGVFCDAWVWLLLALLLCCCLAGLGAMLWFMNKNKKVRSVKPMAVEPVEIQPLIPMPEVFVSPPVTTAVSQVVEQAPPVFAGMETFRTIEAPVAGGFVGPAMMAAPVAVAAAPPVFAGYETMYTVEPPVMAAPVMAAPTLSASYAPLATVAAPMATYSQLAAPVEYLASPRAAMGAPMVATTAYY